MQPVRRNVPEAGKRALFGIGLWSPNSSNLQKSVKAKLDRVLLFGIFS